MLTECTRNSLEEKGNQVHQWARVEHPVKKYVSVFDGESAGS